MIERVMTGILGLDRQLDGGLPKSLLTAISGPIGIGKTCLAWQFLKQGLYNDERVIFMTAKDSPEMLLQSASELGYDLGWALEQQRMFIVDWRNVLSSGSMVQELVPPFLDRIQLLIQEHDINRLVFDPLLPSGFMDSEMSQSFYRSIKAQISDRCQNVSMLALLMEPFSLGLQGDLPFDSWIQLGWGDDACRHRQMRIQKN